MYVGNDPGMTLGEWIIFISLLVLEYGEDAYLYTDAGYNNVGLELTSEEPGIVVGYGRNSRE